MSTAVVQRNRTDALPVGAIAIRDGGLLAGVRRPCREHGRDCACVARTPEGRLVFWCEGADHHFTAR